MGNFDSYPNREDMLPPPAAGAAPAAAGAAPTPGNEKPPIIKHHLNGVQ